MKIVSYYKMFLLIMEKKKKLCFAASTGGHFEQLMMLRPLMGEYDSFILTEKTAYSVAKEGDRVYYLSQVNRKEKSWFFAMIKNSFQSLAPLLSFLAAGCCLAFCVFVFFLLIISP